MRPLTTAYQIASTGLDEGFAYLEVVLGFEGLHQRPLHLPIPHTLAT